MKTSLLKFWSIAYITVFMLITGTVFAQSATNLTGVFEGTRMQYNQAHDDLIKEFTYKFELVQHDNVVQGTSTIISEEGNYAEVGIRGIVIKDKFYFEEYKLLDQITAQGMSWCYKSGVLSINEMKGEIILYGETPSYMINYGIACTGGVTKLNALKNIRDEAISKDMDLLENDISLSLNVYPNPTAQKANINFELKENAEVQIQIIDLSGQIILNTKNKKIAKGNFTEYFDVSKLANGMYIFNINVNGVIYSKEIVKY